MFRDKKRKMQYGYASPENFKNGKRKNKNFAFPKILHKKVKKNKILNKTIVLHNCI